MNHVRFLVPLALFATSILDATASAGQVTISASRDNTMYAESSSESNGAGINVFSGRTGGSQLRRALIAFDVAAAIPAGSTIQSARVVMFMDKSPTTTAFDVELHRVTESWGEGTSVAPSGGGSGGTAVTNDATWGFRFFPGTPWTTAGSTFVSGISSTASVGPVGSYTWVSTPTLVADVQSFLDSPSTNNGWVVKHANEVNGATAKRFVSRTGFTTSRPALIVDFTLPAGAATSSCFGDGTGTVCPCSPGAIGHGCAHSGAAGGALLSATGIASLTSDTFVLQGTSMPNNVAVYFQGTSSLGAGQGIVFGDGLRCAGGSIVRLGTPTNVLGASSYPSAGDLPISVKGSNSVGSVRTYQCWYADTAVYCTPSTFNFTNALNVTWAP